MDEPQFRQPEARVLRRTGEPVERRIDRKLAEASPANRPFIEKGVLYRRSKKLRPPTTWNWVYPLVRLDAFVAGKAFHDLEPDDIARFLAGLTKEDGQPMDASTCKGMASNIKSAWRDLYDSDILSRSWNRAFEVHVRPTEDSDGRIIEPDEFHALLRAAAADNRVRLNGVPCSAVATALLWTLWESGFRADEMLSLNLGDVHLFQDGTAKLRLRPEAPRLGHGEHKTGPRTVAVFECVPAIKALMALHPEAGNPHAPLFPNLHKRRSDQDRMRYNSLDKLLAKLGVQAGLNPSGLKSHNITAHDFRHTAATRDARNGRNEAYLRKKYGWSKKSRMPAHYVALAAIDQHAQVRRDNGIDAMGFPVGQAPVTDVQAIATALAQLVAQQRAPPPGRTPPPNPWHQP